VEIPQLHRAKLSHPNYEHRTTTRPETLELPRKSLGLAVKSSMSNPSALVFKLWNYCSILRDDGLSFLLRQSFRLRPQGYDGKDGGQDGEGA
jgi:hypothetical protein